MKRKTKPNVPKNIRELRRQLAKLGDPWSVIPQLSDDDPLPNLPRGGQSDDEVPKEHRIKPLKRGINLRRLIAAQPPANPFLRARWVEAGLIKEEGIPVEYSEGDGGAA